MVICFALVLLLQSKQTVFAYEENTINNDFVVKQVQQKTTVKNGLVKDNDGIYRYYKNGKLDKTFTGIAQSDLDKKWYYLKEGVFTKWTGLAKNPQNNKWYFVKNGIFDKTYTGIGKNQYGWYYVKNGAVDLTYTGVALRPENGNMYYIKNGKLDWTFTGLAKNHANNTWYYVTLGEVKLGIQKQTSSKTELKGIDISNWQKDISLAEINADFVIVKVSEGIGYVDSYFDQFYQQAKNQRKKLGFYHFARPTGGNDAVREARFFYEQTKSYYREAIPILDWEAENTWNTAYAKEWLDEVYRLSGVKPIIYMNQYTENTYDWTDVVNAGYKLWIAKYGQNLDSINYDMSWVTEKPILRHWQASILWQFTSNGRLNGYSSPLDLNIFYGNETTWDEYAGAPVLKDDSYTGLAKNQYGWYYVNKSIHDNTYTGLAKNQYGWYYVKNGKYISSYTGVSNNQYGWFYVKNGKVDTSYTGLVKRPEDNKWYYVNKGKVDWTYNGLGKSPYGWYKVTNGIVDFTYTGIAKNQYGWYHVKNGKVDMTYTGLAKRPETNNWYYIQKGRLNWNYTGLAQNPANGKWFYVTNGQVDWSYNGTAMMQNKTYTIENGEMIGD